MFDFVLPIFPSGYLSHSVIVPVWIGIAVISFFNLRFGWIYSGLVVPGYLTPLLLIKPLAVFVIVIEAVVTYLIVYTISEAAAKRGLWTNFFGRDRFFMLLLVSVFVRILFDGWLLPQIDNWFIVHYHFSIDYDDSLHSFGLIIVALIANQIWKPGVIGGLFQLFTTTLITYLIMKYVIIEHTNYSLNSIIYMYEDIAESILSSPKSYIILLVTAYIASRMNLFYGWEYNGILVPSLLALEWAQPMKIFVSLIEAFIIYGIATVVLKLPVLKNASIEGARKTLLFFNIGFVYKILISLIIIHFFPHYKISDYFAFGYLLSTLIAVKIYDKVNIPLFTRATMQTTIVAIIIATAIGYILMLLPKAKLYQEHIQTDFNNSISSISDTNSSLLQFIENSKIKYYTRSDNLQAIEPTITQQEAWQEILYTLDKNWQNSKKDLLKLLNIIHYKMTIIQNRYIALLPNIDSVNWGIYIIDMKSTNSLMLELPYPVKDNNMIEATLALHKLLESKRVAISGIAKSTPEHPTVEQSQNYNSLYYIFHKHYLNNAILSIYNCNKNQSVLIFKDYLPKDFSLRNLKFILKDLKVSWGRGLKRSIESKSASGGYAQLHLTKNDKTLLISSQLSKNKISVITGDNSIGVMIQNWLNSGFISIAPKNSNLYIPPTLSQMLYMDRSILIPILNILSTKEAKQNREWLKYQLEPVKISAQVLNYNLIWYQEKETNSSYLILYEGKENTRYWGTYIFKINDAKPVMIQIPHPQYEAYTLEYGLELYEAINAKVMLISGATPVSNSDRSSDVLLPKNKDNIFNLISQVLFRESGKESMNAISIRGKSSLEIEQSSKAILAYDNGLTKSVGLNTTQQFFTNYLKQNIDLMIYDGSKLTAGYGAESFEAGYLEESLNNTFNVLWLPFNMRYEYKRVSNNSSLIAQLESMDIEFIQNSSLTSYIQQLKSANTCMKQNIIDTILHYLSVRDINDIVKLKSNKSIKLQILLTQSNRPYIIILNKKDNTLYAIAKLYSIAPYKIDIVKDKNKITDKIFHFTMSSYAVMEFGDICKE